MAKSKLYGHSVKEFEAELEAAGWYSNVCDFSYRHPNGEAVAREAIRDVCKIHPALTGRFLKILRAGKGFSICVIEDGDETLVWLRPSE